MRNYDEGEKKLLRIFWILVFAIILFGYFVNKKYQEDAAEKERQYDKMLEVKWEMQRGVYPLEGEATAIRFDNYKDLSIIFLPDDDVAEDSFETVGYTYQLEYISDEEYILTAEEETKGERHDGDYAFQCKVKKSGEQYVLCELEMMRWMNFRSVIEMLPVLVLEMILVLALEMLPARVQVTAPIQEIAMQLTATRLTRRTMISSSITWITKTSLMTRKMQPRISLIILNIGMIIKLEFRTIKC